MFKSKEKGSIEPDAGKKRIIGSKRGNGKKKRNKEEIKREKMILIKYILFRSQPPSFLFSINFFVELCYH